MRHKVRWLVPSHWTEPNLERAFGSIIDEMRDLVKRSLDDFPSFYRKSEYPKCYGFRKGKKVYLKFYLPETRKEDVDVRLIGDILVIEGKNKLPTEVAEDEFIIKEIRHGEFRREFQLPKGITEKDIEAKLHDDGVLTVVINEKEKPDNKVGARITIQ